MKAEKITMTIVVEVLSVDSIPSLLLDAVTLIRAETVKGFIGKQDGDQISWDIKKHTKRVEI